MEAIKKRKKRKKLILFFKTTLSFLVFAGLIILVVLFFQGSYFNLKKIDCQIENKECSDEEKIIFADLLGENIFLARVDNFEQKVLADSWQFESVEIEKKLPDRILIKLKTRQPFFNLTFDEKNWWLIDDQGFVLQGRNNSASDLPQVFYTSTIDLKVGQKLEQLVLDSVILMLKQLKEEKLISYQKILVQDNLISLTTSENMVASFSAQKNMQLQVDSLLFILRLSKIEGKLPKFLDLRYDKPVVRF